ncbi:unnamed protein product [Heterobilharzia americana]|nr:unnamed protein product [Heterobilharzia americana]
MLKIIQELLIYIYLIKLFSIESLLTNEKPEGYRVERVGIHGIESTLHEVPGAQLQLAESSAVKSCLTPANLLVCKFDMDPGNIMNPDVDSYSHLCSLTDDQRFGTLPTWILDLKQKAEFRQDHICIRQLLFYISVICSGVITIILITSTIILAVRYRRLVQKMKRRQNVIDGINVWSQSSEISSQCETDGKLDILTDSVFNRAAGGGSFARESYKEALVNSGYQRISNGRIKNLRASGKNRPGTVT